MEKEKPEISKVKNPNRLEEPVLPTKQIAGILAQMTHDPNCKLCHGKGYLGYRIADTQILFCRCAFFKTDGFVYVMQHVKEIEKASSYTIDLLEQDKKETQSLNEMNHAIINSIQELALRLECHHTSSLRHKILKLFGKNTWIPIRGKVSDFRMETENAG